MIENSKPDATIASISGHKFVTIRSSIPASTCRWSKSPIGVTESAPLLTAHPITSCGILRDKMRRFEFIYEESARPHSWEPPALNRLQAARARPIQEGWLRLRAPVFRLPATGARTIAWEPITRRMCFIDGPDKGLPLARSRRNARSKKCNGWLPRRNGKGGARVHFTRDRIRTVAESPLAPPPA